MASFKFMLNHSFNTPRASALILLALILSSCGGGGGDETSPPPSKSPTNTIPNFINSSSSVNNVQIPMYGTAWSEGHNNNYGHLDNWHTELNSAIQEPLDRPKESGQISDSEFSETSVTVNIPVAGNVNFKFKIDSEENYDYLIFYIDGIAQGSASGSIDWTPTEFPISEGIHTLQWKYVKDDSNSHGLDTAWIDEVSIPTSPAMQMGGTIMGTPLTLTTAVTTFAGSGVTGSNDDFGTAASFSGPYRITTDGTYLYVADTLNYKIRKILIATGEVSTIAGSGIPGTSDGIGTLAQFYNPQGITFYDGNLYVADYSVIRKIVIATGEVTTFAGSVNQGRADGIGTAAEFFSLTGITNDGISLYVTDFVGNAIRKIVIATANVSTFAGYDGTTIGSGGNGDGWGTYAQFFNPAAITTDGTNLYVSDHDTHRIRQINIASQQVITIAGTGNIGSSDNSLLGTQASFYSPRGITTDGTYLYIADLSNNKIRKIDIATTAVSSLAGSGGIGSTDNTGILASFYSPSGITSDGTNLYVVDSGNNTIRKIQ